GALSSTISLIDQLVAEEGGQPERALNVLLTNGEILAALHRAAPGQENDPKSRMVMRVVHGRADMDQLVADDALRRVRLTDPGALRFTLIASDFAEGQSVGLAGEGTQWTALPPRAIVAMTRDAPPLVETF
ncbi:MAG: hypothetical protein ABI175_27100, partial [Polyangiales bacterium]